MRLIRITSAAFVGCVVLAGAPETVRAQGATQGSVSIAETTGTLKGRVLDDAGQPMPNVEINYYFMSEATMQPPALAGGAVQLKAQPVQMLGRGRSEADGNFMLRGISKGQMVISVKQPGFAMFVEKVNVPVDDVEIKLRRPYTLVSGNVVDLDGAPVAAARVVMNPERAMTYGFGSSIPTQIAPDRVVALTDENGKFETDQLPDGPILVDASTEGGLRLVPTAGGMYTTATVTTDAPLVLQPIMVYPGYTLKGQVRDAESKAPIAGAEVGFMMGGRRLGGSDVEPVKTDAEGNYSVTGANPTPDKKGGAGALQFLFFQAKADGYKTEITNPKVAGFDKDYLTVTQDFALTKE